MKVCFFSHQSDYIYGGEKVTLGLARSLRETIEVCFAMPKGIYRDEVVAQEFANYTVPSKNFSRSLFGFWQFLVAWMETSDCLSELVKKESISVVHATSLKSMVYAWLLGVKRGVPVVWHHHDILRNSFMNRLWLRLISLGAEKIVLVSEAAKEAMLDAGVVSTKLIVVRNGLDKNAWPCKDIDASRTSAPFILGFVGELSSRKGVDWIPEILKSLDRRQNSRSVRATVVGEGLSDPAFAADLRKRCAELVTRGLISFEGRQENISQWMRKFDVLLVPSRQDPFPTVIMEANFSGVPVLARPRGGIPEMVRNGVSGWLLESPEGFVERIRELLSDADTAKAMAENARNYAESEFSLEKMATEFLEIYRAITKKYT